MALPAAPREIHPVGRRGRDRVRSSGKGRGRGSRPPWEHRERPRRDLSAGGGAGAAGEDACGRSRRTETPEMVTTMLFSLRRFPRALVRTRGWSVRRGPNKRLLIRPGRGRPARGAQLERRRAPPSKRICLKIGLSICESTFRLFALTPRLCRSSRDGTARGRRVSSEGSKLHPAARVCFKCHSAPLSRNEAPRTDFLPRLRGIRPSKRRIQSSSLWRIRVRSLKSTIYSNIDISTCQKRGALKFPLSTVVRRIARNVSDNS